MSSTSTAFRRLATRPSAASGRHARRLADVAGTRRHLRDPPRRVDTGIPARVGGAGPGRCGAGGVLDGAPDRLAALPAGGVRGDRGLGRGAGRLGYRMDLLLGSSAALYLLAASRQPPTPWTWRTTVTVVGLLLAYGRGRHRAAELPASELLHTGLAWAVAWFAGERTRLAARAGCRAQRPCRARRAGGGRVSGCWPPPPSAPDRPRPPRLRRPRDQRDRRARRRGPAAAPPGPRSHAARFGGDRGAGTADGRGARSAGRHPARGRPGQWRGWRRRRGLGRWTP